MNFFIYCKLSSLVVWRLTELEVKPYMFLTWPSDGALIITCNIRLVHAGFPFW